MKRGLKGSINANSYAGFGMVEKSSPMKRGLKVSASRRVLYTAIVEKSSPMKRGLKASATKGSSSKPQG